MMSLERFIFEMAAGTAIFLLLATAFALASEKHITKLEKLTRNRVLGLLIALPALISCIPHAQIVAPGILQNPLVLWFLALAIPVLSYFYIDFYTARAIGGAMIILAYDVIHVAYEEALCGAAVLTVAAWLFGFAGIWMSGKPCALRDWFRLASKDKMFRFAATVISLVCAGVFVFTLVARCGKLK